MAKYFRQKEIYYKIYNSGKIESIDLSDENDIKYSILSNIPLNVKSIGSSTYRYACHKFFNSRNFTWTRNGITYTTTEADKSLFWKQHNKYLFTNDKKELPIFYLGKVWYFQYFIADCNENCCYLVQFDENDRVSRKTITKIKNLKQVKQL